MSDRPVVRQLSVFIANESGRVSEVTALLGEHGINIRGFSVSDTAEFGILRLVVDRPDEARTALHDAGFTVREDEVICIDLPDRPGGLAGVLKVVAEAGVNIEYVYSLVSTFVVINVTDVDRALHLLGDRPVKLVSQDDIAAIHL
ncbi:MAG: ACT domain-containing protein [Coriobacteriia bacterium]|nr:ACT domain-containing protein [Coriobacteriia bacterium]